MRLGSCPCEDLYEASFAVTFLSVLSRCCFQRLRQPWPWARCCWTLHQGRITLDLQQRLLASAFADPACSCIGWSRHGSRRKILFDTMAHLRELYRKLAVRPRMFQLSQSAAFSLCSRPCRWGQLPWWWSCAEFWDAASRTDATPRGEEVVAYNLEASHR